MKKAIFVLALALVAALSPLAAQPAAKASHYSDFGLIFDLQSLLLSTDSFEDGYQAGAGLKWWMRDKLALRGLFTFEFNSLEAVNETMAGLSAGLEWHPAPKKISPYLGGFLGMRMTAVTAEDPAFDLYMGGMGGVEMAIWQNINVYGEYELVASLDADGFTVGMGGPGAVHLGLIVYF
jgi:hypothetical protein